MSIFETPPEPKYQKTPGTHGSISESARNGTDSLQSTYNPADIHLLLRRRRIEPMKRLQSIFSVCKEKPLI